MVVLIGGVFGQEEQLRERLCFPPDEASDQGDQPPSPSRWTLARVQAHFPNLSGYSLPGVWKVLQAAGIRWRQGRHQMYSPDPEYSRKLEHLLAVLREVATSKGSKVALFVDEMGFYRWPEPAYDWSPSVPVADRKKSHQGQWRLIGSLDAISGRVLTLDDYIVGRRQVCAFLQQLDQSYPHAEQIYIIWDNWSIHSHEEVEQCLSRLPRLSCVSLPTYAPWLNPIEKVWRFFRQDLLSLHRFANAWKQLLERIHAFFALFAHGSTQLLQYVGLRGDGKLASALVVDS